MDVEKVKEKRKQLEKDLAKEIKNFEEQSGMKVNSIEPIRYKGGDNLRGQIRNTKVNVKLN